MGLNAAFELHQTSETGPGSGKTLPSGPCVKMPGLQTGTPLKHNFTAFFI